MAEHGHPTNYLTDVDNVTILCSQTSYYLRLVEEAIELFRFPTNTNTDEDFESHH